MSAQTFKYCQACGAQIASYAETCRECGALQPTFMGPSGRRDVGMQDPALRDANSKKITAALCGILLGSFGIHKFVLGMNSAGTLMALVTILTCGAGGLLMGTIGLIEGIIYISKSDEDFYETYIVEKKSWF